MGPTEQCHSSERHWQKHEMRTTKKKKKKGKRKCSTVDANPNTSHVTNFQWLRLEVYADCHIEH